jgi:aminoglycoside phosphotransferase (APT) family kinase protein
VTDLEKIAEGRETELFLLPGGRILRLYRAEFADADERARREEAGLAAARAAGAPVPAVYERTIRDGRHGLVIERLDGTDLLTLVGRRPWLVSSVARRTGRLHAELHQVHGPAELPTIAEFVSTHLERSGAVPGELRDEVLRALEQLPEGDRLCHGDFHPGNVLATRDHASVIDWHNACVGDPTADVARTWVLLEFSPLPPGASRMERAQARVGRGLLLRGYMGAYGRAAKLDSERLARWIRIRAIERLAEEVPGERDVILERLAGPPGHGRDLTQRA